MKSVKLIEFPVFKEDNGELSVFEHGNELIPFSIKRIFNVMSEKGSTVSYTHLTLPTIYSV